jgi:hypothetical protein
MHPFLLPCRPAYQATTGLKNKAHLAALALTKTLPKLMSDSLFVKARTDTPGSRTTAVPVSTQDSNKATAAAQPITIIMPGSQSNVQPQPGSQPDVQPHMAVHQGSQSVVLPHQGSQLVVQPHPGSQPNVQPHPGSQPNVLPHPGSQSYVLPPSTTGKGLLGLAQILWLGKL